MRVPDAVTGALIALTGVLLTQVSLHVIEWIRTKRDRERAQRERQLLLKRDAYLPLVHAFAEGMTLFLSIPQTHHSKLSELKLSQDAQNALGTASLIANERVISAVNNASKQLARGSLRLMTAKIEEAKLGLDIENLNLRIKQLSDASRLIIDRMKSLQDAGRLNSQLATAIDAEFQQTQSEFPQLFAQQREKSEKKNDILRELQKQAMREIVELAAVSAPAVIEIRRDLEIPTDADALTEQVKDSISFVEEVFPGFVDEIWTKAINRKGN